MTNMNWAILPKASKAVFPVIACHCDKNGLSFPGERTIGILSGNTDKTVREGLRGLRDFPEFKMSYYITKRGRKAKRFFLNLPSQNLKGRSFPFYKFLLESGQWRELKPTAKALYPVMRHWGYFDIYKYAEEEDLELDECDMNEIYPVREYDFCEAEKRLMAEHAGISVRSINGALVSLQNNFLVELLGGMYGWKVYLKSKDQTIWKRDYLNKKIMKAYKHELF
jgi:hypothetical protein